MTLNKGQSAYLKADERTNWHNVLGYPEVTVTEHTQVWVISGPNPYVTIKGTFYLVETRQGDATSVVAVDASNLKPAKTLTHYIAMSGTHGCLPDSCNAYSTYQDAVSALVDLFGLGRTRKVRLSTYEHLELNPRDGAEYCEITECTCAKPWEHCDAGDDPRDWEGYGREPQIEQDRR